MKNTVILLLFGAISFISIHCTDNSVMASISVKTKVFDSNSQPPIVGGVIDDYNQLIVSEKGIIVITTNREVFDT